MRLFERKNKWVLTDDNETVLLITRDRGVALKIARKANERFSKDGQKRKRGNRAN